jgi:hypothetical protein
MVVLIGKVASISKYSTTYLVHFSCCTFVVQVVVIFSLNRSSGKDLAPKRILGSPLKIFGLAYFYPMIMCISIASIGKCMYVVH